MIQEVEEHVFRKSNRTNSMWVLGNVLADKKITCKFKNHDYND